MQSAKCVSHARASHVRVAPRQHAPTTSSAPPGATPCRSSTHGRPQSPAAYCMPCRVTCPCRALRLRHASTFLPRATTPSRGKPSPTPTRSPPARGSFEGMAAPPCSPPSACHLVERAWRGRGRIDRRIANDAWRPVQIRWLRGERPVRCVGYTVHGRVRLAMEEVLFFPRTFLPTSNAVPVL